MHGLQVVLIYQEGCQDTSGFDSSCGATVRIFDSEKALLQAWLGMTREYDPDCFVSFQVRILLYFIQKS